MYDAEDGLVTPTHDHTAVKKLVFDHFKVATARKNVLLASEHESKFFRV